MFVILICCVLFLLLFFYFINSQSFFSIFLLAWRRNKQKCQIFDIFIWEINIFMTLGSWIFFYYQSNKKQANYIFTLNIFLVDNVTLLLLLRILNIVHVKKGSKKIPTTLLSFWLDGFDNFDRFSFICKAIFSILMLFLFFKSKIKIVAFIIFFSFSHVVQNKK